MEDKAAPISQVTFINETINPTQVDELIISLRFSIETREQTLRKLTFLALFQKQLILKMFYLGIIPTLTEILRTAEAQDPVYLLSVDLLSLLTNHVESISSEAQINMVVIPLLDMLESKNPSMFNSAKTALLALLSGSGSACLCVAKSGFIERCYDAFESSRPNQSKKCYAEVLQALISGTDAVENGTMPRKMLASLQRLSVVVAEDAPTAKVVNSVATLLKRRIDKALMMGTLMETEEERWEKEKKWAEELERRKEDSLEPYGGRRGREIESDRLSMSLSESEEAKKDKKEKKKDKKDKKDKKKKDKEKEKEKEKDFDLMSLSKIESELSDVSSIYSMKLKRSASASGSPSATMSRTPSVSTTKRREVIRQPIVVVTNVEEEIDPTTLTFQFPNPGKCTSSRNVVECLGAATSCVAINEEFGTGIWHVELKFIQPHAQQSFGICDFSYVIPGDYRPGRDFHSAGYYGTDSAPMRHGKQWHLMNERFGDGDIVAVEMDFESNPTQAHFFVNGNQQKTTFTHIPAPLKVVFELCEPKAKVEVVRVARVSESNAKPWIDTRKSEVPVQWGTFGKRRA
ncbi:uncharacterized protein MONOS_5107 [Monocercomonoides exilis]|uniref:uncharacterized protein n=1 Tax=Monocercomonoides exilis TaxID=2049356 RepID=UPI00355A5144|nr:hypothetical protein MONOS_5107 [Monocercomonoides exilis]|eukprot:MONOS_5107.1-p1 / transcript=MONOS_5107.1 / gene=MONOS_5107 / organism=Monocercomonoides_exilis_PA203 / gene_product=unspecified product / transcript_product=unspecified product / location=Mono_scaffold00145:35778-38270(-) / protein_length=575 / sequence_SO=supercontig / SO=protein_coding / is_pseudo=false